ncbi:MAG: hypothetical protein IJU44_03460 [Kiritimatiellae bacterium]|nr:hypothetical protein [Kiritimatiellia bacterium]
MKRVMLVALLMAGFATVFTGCKKEETIGEKLDKGINATEKAAKDAAKKVEKAAKDAEKATEKAASDLKKKLDEATK